MSLNEQYDSFYKTTLVKEVFTEIDLHRWQKIGWKQLFIRLEVVIRCQMSAV